MDNHVSVEQRTDYWFELRNSRFTSSKASNLISVGKRPMTEEELKEHKKNNPKSRVTTTECIGESFYSYCFEVAENSIFGRPEEDKIETFDMQRGNVVEPLIFNSFKEQMALEFKEVKKCGFFTLGKHEGSSPDGLVDDDAVLEIKAPRRSKFFRIVRDGIDALDKEWLIQVQHQMRVTKRDKAFFVVGYFGNGRLLLHHLEIERDDKMQTLFKKRVKEAIKIKEEYKQYLIDKFL